jgi:DNA-binding response OmpR family regulator
MMKKILIVEDERLLGRMLAKTLKDCGYQVCDVLASGEEAVAFARRVQVDAIVMDISLNGEMDGFEAACMLRKEHRAPIIFLTCFRSDEDMDRARKIRKSLMIDVFQDLHAVPRLLEMAVA